MKRKRAADLSVPIEMVIRTLRAERVILDTDLARVYGVETRVLNQAVQRNLEKFPSDFMFRLSLPEARELNRSQTVTGLQKHRNPATAPMPLRNTARSWLRMYLTVRVLSRCVFVVRAFVRLRQMIGTHKEMAAKLAELERKVASHGGNIKALFEAIRQLMAPPKPGRRPIGFVVKEKAARYRAGGRGRRGRMSRLSEF